jgi:hypothetical protein
MLDICPDVMPENTQGQSREDPILHQAHTKQAALFIQDAAHSMPENKLARSRKNQVESTMPRSRAMKNRRVSAAMEATFRRS